MYKDKRVTQNDEQYKDKGDVMDTPAMTLQIPAGVYARLQSLAAREHADPAEIVERLVNAGLLPLAEAVITDPHLHGGRPVIAGSGVTVRTIVGYYKLGFTPEESADEMGVELASVYAALAYYHLHRDEIEADILANSEQAVMQEFGA